MLQPVLGRLRRALPVAMLMAATAATGVSAQTADADAPQRGDIVVTARSLQDTADALAACLARNCPPDEDIAATLAHAENQFVAGDYRDARGTMLASLRRNRRHGDDFPVEVSDLLRANGRVAAHLGEVDSFRLSVLDMRDTLRSAFTANDPRVLAAQIEVADSRARLGYPREARDGYVSIAEQATAIGQHRVAAFARIRQAAIDIPRNKVDRIPSLVRESRAQLEQIAASPQQVGVDIALVADVMLARLDREDGDNSRTQALIRRFSAGEGASRPLLISGDPIRLPDADNINPDEAEGGNVLMQMQTANVNRRWIDVGYWINADGRVSDFEVLRSEGDRNWSRYVAASVNSRVYTPIRSADGLQSQGFYIIERYTLTADWRDAGDCTGSHIRCRSSRLRVERIDLTPEDLAADAAPATESTPASAG